MMIPVLGGPEEGGVSWVDEREIARMPLEPETPLNNSPQLVKWHVEHILAHLARAAQTASGSVISLIATMVPR